MARRPAEPAALEARLGYRFGDRALLAEALTHVSRASAGATYQRLEFLGDRVLGLAIADMLMRTYPGTSEGELSLRLAELVRRETCAEVALAWDLGPHLSLGRGGTPAIRRNPSILADACEAVIGAVFRDGGFAAAQELVERGFGAKLATLAELPFNPKTLLQEWAATQGRAPPTYHIRDRSGPDHAPHFTVIARVEGLAEGVGAGGSRRGAEQAAAAALLEREGVRSGPANQPAATFAREVAVA